jgi:hypothetical protein
VKEAQREKESIILKLRALNLTPEQKALIDTAIKDVE